MVKSSMKRNVHQPGDQTTPNIRKKYRTKMTDLAGRQNKSAYGQFEALLRIFQNSGKGTRNKSTTLGSIGLECFLLEDLAAKKCGTKFRKRTRSFATWSLST